MFAQLNATPALLWPLGTSIRTFGTILSGSRLPKSCGPGGFQSPIGSWQLACLATLVDIQFLLAFRVNSSWKLWAVNAMANNLREVGAPFCIIRPIRTACVSVVDIRSENCQIFRQSGGMDRLIVPLQDSWAAERPRSTILRVAQAEDGATSSPKHARTLRHSMNA
jgi:hypothetical protein